MDGQQHRLFTLWRIAHHVATVGGAACRSLIRRMAGISTTSTKARAWSAFGLEEGGAGSRWRELRSVQRQLNWCAWKPQPRLAGVDFGLVGRGKRRDVIQRLDQFR